MSRYGKLREDGEEPTDFTDPWPIRAYVPKKKPWWIVRAVKYAALFTLASMVGGTVGSIGFVNDCEAQEAFAVPDSNAIVILVQNYQPAPYHIYLWVRGQYQVLGTSFPGQQSLWVVPSKGLENDSTVYLGWMQAGTHQLESSEPTVRRAGKIKLIRAQLGRPPQRQEANTMGIIRCREGYRPIKCALT